ncbi:Z1 domain-containing protein [Paenibacillus sp. GP183]|uniref:Z1 domain-containing protein n=1 Tax=Paenibacillus sp. GP183 TaxID=1882751 RepID=UPI00089713ED|nr:Z1 domain-containing protein [Paenibacillus sp. GP183]SED07155.1 Z1 domain-containing protein [Paenibacillus sp. GP183]
MHSSNLINKLETLVMTFIRLEPDDVVLTEQSIKEHVLQAKQTYENKYKEIINDEVVKSVIRNLHSNYDVTIDKGTVIVDKDTQHQSWYFHRRSELDLFFWNRFKEYLLVEKKWNSKMISSLEDISDDIIDLLGDPSSEKPWKRRGLILGDVQSGKTVNYTAICNKAADAKYKVIILLTGTLENLRRQTQERLDSDFVGRDSNGILSQGKDGRNISVGVGRFGQKKFINTFTSVNSDFSSNTLNNFGFSLKNNSDPVIFVVKKNKTILKNLDRWLKVFNADDKGIVDLPMLLIDDEADSASINTKGEDDPTAINEAIRQLLERFNRSTYLAVTATPFANIFINPDTKDDMLGNDLFPNDFIYSLSPPSSYIGSNAIFGEDAIYEDRLVEISDDVLPEKLNKNSIIDEIPESMLESLGYFLLVNAVRDFRNDHNDHRSMLVNVSHLTSIQDQFSDHIKTWLQKVRSDIQNFGKLELKESLKKSSLIFLCNIWNKYNFSNLSGTDWETIQKDYLYSAVSPIEVRSVNRLTGSSSLNFNAYKEMGLRVIAVGGYSLSRGLTLEGLVVSYFYRNSKMYDTLMQMGRWFGYRRGYEDLFRIWMKFDAINWYRSITAATNELREQIKKMNRLNMSPKDFGLKVRYDPTSLVVTARNKMKYTKTVDCLISVSGRLLETPRLPNNEAILNSNFKSFIKLVNKLDLNGTKHELLKKQIWSNVPREIIVEFINNFSVDPSDLKFYLNPLPDYIENSVHLENWDIYISSGKGEEFKSDEIPESIKINKINRNIKVDGSTILVNGTKVRVGSGGETKNGLSKDQIDRIIKEYKIEYPEKDPSDNAYLISGRRPLLILHVIQPTEIEDTEGNKHYKNNNPLIAFGLGFPNVEQSINDRLVKYVLNPTEIKNRMRYEEDDENEID